MIPKLLYEPKWLTYHEIQEWYGPKAEGRMTIPVDSGPRMTIDRPLGDSRYTLAARHDGGSLIRPIVVWQEDGTARFELHRDMTTFCGNRIKAVLPVWFSKVGREFRVYRVGEDGAFGFNTLELYSDSGGRSGQIMHPFHIDPAWVDDHYRELIRRGAPIDLIIDRLLANGCRNMQLISLLRHSETMTPVAGYVSTPGEATIRELAYEAVQRMIDAAVLPEDRMPHTIGWAGAEAVTLLVYNLRDHCKTKLIIERNPVTERVRISGGGCEMFLNWPPEFIWRMPSRNLRAGYAFHPDGPYIPFPRRAGVNYFLRFFQ